MGRHIVTTSVLGRTSSGIENNTYKHPAESTIVYGLSIIRNSTSLKPGFVTIGI